MISFYERFQIVEELHGDHFAVVDNQLDFPIGVGTLEEMQEYLDFLNQGYSITYDSNRSTEFGGE